MKSSLIKAVKTSPIVIVGALIFTFGLEFFLLPNNMIDGGIVGISIMVRELFGISFSVLLIILNIPFFYLGYKQIGLSFCMSTIIAIITVSLASTKMHELFHFEHFTNEMILLAIFGGVLMGLGVGIVTRAGGTTDGVEILALVLSNKSPIAFGTWVLIINSFILLSSSFVFGLESALASLIAYYVASKIINLVMEGMDKSRSIMIISDKHKEIGEALKARLGRAVTYLNGEGGYNGDEKKIIFVVISDLEDTKLKATVKEIDNGAFIVTNHVSEVHGSNFKKRGIH